MPEIIDLATAAGLVRDGDTLLVGGSGGGHGVPEAFLVALAERFRATGAPRGLTLWSVVSIGDGLKQIEFSVRVSPGLRPMDRRLFRAEPMGLIEEFRSRARPRARRR